MKIGILGTNSYIGDSFVTSVKDNPQYEITSIDTFNDAWKNESFADYSVLLCVAGIAHVSSDPSKEQLYFSVNRDLPVAMAKKAKAEGVKHFIFMSSIIVYGDDAFLGKELHITRDTKPTPANFYGMSKLQAEEQLLVLSDPTFKVLIIRTPMVYGPLCKGNFPKLVKIAKKILLFPQIDNKRSYIFIYNLCAFFEYAIMNELSGIQFPQDSEYITTTEIVKYAASYYGHKVRFTKVFNPLLVLLSKKIGFINKVFGSKFYDESLSPNINEYNLYSKKDALLLSIKDTL